MAEKDITEKLLEDYNDVFADIVNVLLFDGKRVVSPEKLQETGVKSQYKAGAKIHELERDVAKLWQEGNVQIALCGLENQTKSERDMPLRVIGYDGNSYRAQLLNPEKRQRYPVLTLVLYFGMERWNQPKNLKKLLNIPKELDEYINDYKINVFEIAWLTEEQVNQFQSDFRIVADYFVQMRKNNTYNPSSQELRHVDEVLKLLSVFGEDERFKAVSSGKIAEGGIANMNKWLDEVIEKGIEQGIEKGIEQGKEQGIEALILDNIEDGFDREKIVAKLMKRFGISREQAEGYYEKYALQSV